MPDFTAESGRRPPDSRRSRSRLWRLGGACVAVALAVSAVAAVSSPAAAQQGDAEVRIVARKLESGRIEFGLQQRQADNSWGQRQLPRVRFFPPTASVNRWLASSALDLPAGDMRIVARKLESGRIEFGLQQRQADDSWGERRLPRVRFFPTTATVGRWLASSPLSVTAAPTGDADNGAGADGRPQQGAGPYRDVSADAWYADAVAALAEDGVFAGTLCEDGFCPDDPIDDKTMAVWTVRVFDRQDPAGVSESRSPRGFYEPFILRTYDLRASSACIGNASGRVGLGDLGGSPDSHETRHEAVSFLAAFFCLPTGVPDPGFSDVPRTAWYVDLLSSAAAWGLTLGCDNAGRFCPNRLTTRAEMAAFLWEVQNPPHPQEPPDESTRQTYSELNSAMEGGGIISAGTLHACALRSDQTVTCWGNHFDDRMNYPPFRFLGVSAGRGFHSCGVRVDQTIACWGRGIPGWHATLLPATAPPSGRFTAVSAGGWHVCGLRIDGTINCWWSHAHYKPNDRQNFGQVDAPSGRFTAISSGVGHSCGIRADGTAACWGDNRQRQLDVPSGRFTAISVGSVHSCGIRADGSAACWGDNRQGQLDVPSGRFTAISAGWEYSCGIQTDQTITCWGLKDELDRIRHGYYEPFSNVVRDVPSGRFIAIGSFGPYDASCAVRIDGAVVCWGTETQGGGLRDPSRAVWASTPVAADCPQRAANAGEPGRPADVQATTTGAIDASGHLVRSYIVRWTRPCNGGRVDHYLVQWRRGHEDFDNDRQWTVEAHDTTNVYSLRIRDRSLYAIRVIAVNDDGRSSSADLIIPTPTNEVRTMVESVVSTHQSRYPWLRDVWHYMNQKPTDIEANYCVIGSFLRSCVSSTQWLRISSPHIPIPHTTTVLQGIIVHELAHLYDHFLSRQISSKVYYGSAEQVIDNAVAIASAELFLYVHFPECQYAHAGELNFGELLADMPRLIMIQDGSLDTSAGRWDQCAVATTGLSSFWSSEAVIEAHNVARSVFQDQEIPQWFYDTFQRADGTWDIAAIRSASGDLERTRRIWLRELIPEL